MAISVTLAVSPAAPAHGSTVTATYTVSGNASASGTVSGSAVIGTQTVAVSTTVTLPALPQSFAVPTCPGLTFAKTAAPNVFTALVP